MLLFIFLKKLGPFLSFEVIRACLYVCTTRVRALACLKRSKRTTDHKTFLVWGAESVCASFYSKQYITLHSIGATADAKLQLQREKRRNI